MGRADPDRLDPRRPGAGRLPRSATSAGSSPTRPTSGSSTPPATCSASTATPSSRTSSATATPPPARSRSRSTSCSSEGQIHRGDLLLTSGFGAGPELGHRPLAVVTNADRLHDDRIRRERTTSRRSVAATGRPGAAARGRASALGHARTRLAQRTWTLCDPWWACSAAAGSRLLAGRRSRSRVAQRGDAAARVEMAFLRASCR